jgi:hypothetical protein
MASIDTLDAGNGPRFSDRSPKRASSSRTSSRSPGKSNTLNDLATRSSNTRRVRVEFRAWEAETVSRITGTRIESLWARVSVGDADSDIEFRSEGEREPEGEGEFSFS